MKIEQLNEQIKGIEEKLKNLRGEAESASDVLKKEKDEQEQHTAKQILAKYLKTEEQEKIVEIKRIKDEKRQIWETVSKEKRDATDAEGKRLQWLTEKHWSIREPLECILVERIKPASQDEKLVAGKYLTEQVLITGGCHCEFGFYKNPTTCGVCKSGERTLTELGLVKLAEYQGARCYKIPDKLIESALARLSTKSLAEAKNLRDRLSDKIENLEKRLHPLRRKQSAYQILDRAGVDYEKVEEAMPEFFKMIYTRFATADPEKRVGVILHEKSWDSKSAGMEYGVDVIVWRDGKSEKVYFKYRDAYSARGDAWHLAFREAKIKEVTKDKVAVELKSNSYTTTRTFNLAENTGYKTIEEKNDEEFLKRYSAVKQELVKTHTRENGQMPDYIPMLFVQGSFPMGTTTGRMIPYERAEVIDECINGNEAVVIVRAQIDHGGGRGRQYEWVAYKVNKSGKEQIARDTVWDLEARNGKIVEIKADDLMEAEKRGKNE
jgi:hypothetical protein